MKKNLLSLIAFIFFYSSAFSQISIQDTSGVTVPNGDTLTVNGIVGYQMSLRVYIYSSTIPIPVEAICNPTTTQCNGCTYSICVGPNCYKTVGVNTGFTSPYFTLPNGKDTNAFFEDYNAVNAGTTVMMYEIRNKNGNDSTWFFVKFIATPTGIANIMANNLTVSNPYPNPANSIVSFTYHTNYAAQLSIYNSLGQLVKNVSLSASKGNLSVDVSDIPAGIYICKIQSVGAETAFRRLVVSH